MRGRPLAKAAIRHCQQNFLGFRQGVKAFRRQRDFSNRFLNLRHRGRFRFIISAAPALRRRLQIGRAFFCAGFHMAQHGKRNHRIALRQLDATHAGGIAPSKYA